MFSDALQKSRWRMLKGGLAPSVVSRMTRELEDHYSDLRNCLLAEGLREADADLQARRQVGDLVAISDAALAKPELKSMISRYPKTTLLIVPFTIFILIAVALIGAVACLLSIHPIPEGEHPPAWFFALFTTLKVFYLYLLPAVLAIAVTVLGLNRLISPSLVTAAVVLIAFVGSWLNVYLYMPTGTGSGSIGATLNLMGFVPGPNRIMLDVMFNACLRMVGTSAFALGAGYFVRRPVHYRNLCR